MPADSRSKGGDGYQPDFEGVWQETERIGSNENRINCKDDGQMSEEADYHCHHEKTQLGECGPQISDTCDRACDHEADTNGSESNGQRQKRCHQSLKIPFDNMPVTDVPRKQI